MSGKFPIEPDDAELRDCDVGADDYEEISSDEVDRVIEALETLAATVESENIRFHLNEATDAIYLLIYGDDDQPQSEAA
jgi:hypothetical protein